MVAWNTGGEDQQIAGSAAGRVAVNCSITNRSVQGSADDIVTENGIKRASNTAYKRSTSPTKASIGRSSGSTISNVEKPAADRLSVGKTPSHKPHSSITSTHRSTRPVQYSPQSASQIRPSRKPSRISPSPIPVKQKLSSPVLEPAMTKERPALGKPPFPCESQKF